MAQSPVMTKRNKPRSQRRQRVGNAFDRPQSGQGTQYDFNTGQVPAFPWMNGSAQDKFCVQLFITDWAARKIVNIPVDDMLRDGWQYEGLTDVEQKAVNAANDELGTLEVFRQALRLERLVGGSAIYLGAVDGETNPEVPLQPEKVTVGGLKFLNALPRSRFTRVEWEQNPLSPHYGRPQFYWVNGQKVHRTRFVFFKGDPLMPVPDYTIMPSGLERNDGFGMSVLIPVMDDLQRATGSRQAAYQLLQRASVFLAAMDVEGLSGTTQGDAAIQAMKDLVNQINLYRGGVVHKDPGDAGNPITTIAAQFGSVPELLMSFLQVLSASGDIPATRFLGQAPGGLNATGESDLENYYGRIEADRTQHVEPPLLFVQKLVVRSVMGVVPPNFAVTFTPLWSLSEAEEADVRAKNIDNVVKLTQEFLMTQEEAIQELQNRDAVTVKLSGEAEPEEPPAAATITPEQAAQQLLQ